jgi:hypothetical protein
MSSCLKIAEIFAFLTLFFVVFTEFTQAQTDSIYRLPAGTRIRLKMDDAISSDVATANDTFTATIAKAVVVREAVVLPAGTAVEGRIVKARAAATGGRSGQLEIRIETLKLPEGEKREIEGVPVNQLKAASSGAGSVLSIAGGTVLGALLGAVSKTSNGALIGAGIGAGAGTGVALWKKGKDVRIKRSEEFEIELKKEVTLPVQDY